MPTIVALAGLLLTMPLPPSNTPQFELTRVAVDVLGGGDATISPDGTRFLTSSRRSGNWDVWEYDLRSSKWRQLTFDPADDFEARWSPAGERIVFTSTRGGQKDIWMLTPGAGKPSRVTSAAEDEEYPAWSADGASIVWTGGSWPARNYFVAAVEGGPTRAANPRPLPAGGACSFHPSGDSLVCHKYESGDGDLIRLWLDNGEMTPLTSGAAWDYKPTVAPDGRWVAFSRSDEGPANIWLLDLHDGRAKPLIESPFEDRWPTWSSDGRRLLFHRIVERGREVRLLDRATGESRALVGSDDAPLQASLSPDGRLLVACVQTGDGKRLRSFDLESGRVVDLNTGPGEACFPRWSPAGDRIAFVTKPSRRWEVAVMDADGGNIRVLTDEVRGLRGLDGPVDWSPDGRKLVFMSDTAAFESDLFVADLAGGEVTNLTRDAWFDEAPSWTSDGSGIVFMSTRGDNWTWGLFRLSLADGSTTTLAGPDYVQKNYPRAGTDGALVWSRYSADGVEQLALREPGGDVRVLPAAGSGVRWPSFTAGSRSILYTTVDHYVEYWLVENVLGRGSPLHARRSSRPRAEVRAAASHGAELAGSSRGSPVDLGHR